MAKRVITKDRYIAIFDILGFKDWVKENDHETIYKELDEIKRSLGLQENISKALRSYPAKYKSDRIPKSVKVVIEHVLFSDTILFITSSSPHSFAAITMQSRFLIQRCLSKGIPIKGCIAKGLISFNKDRQIIFGRPIIDAYLLSEEMKFMGIILDKSVEEEIIKYSNTNFLKGKVPLKSGSINYNYLDIKCNLPYENKQKEIELYNGINNMYHRVNGAPRIYYDNTLSLFYPNEVMKDLGL